MAVNYKRENGFFPKTDIEPLNEQDTGETRPKLEVLVGGKKDSEKTTVGINKENEVTVKSYLRKIQTKEKIKSSFENSLRKIEELNSKAYKKRSEKGDTKNLQTARANNNEKYRENSEKIVNIYDEMQTLKSELENLTGLKYSEILAWYKKEQKKVEKVAAREAEIRKAQENLELAANKYAQEGIDMDAANSESQQAIFKEAKADEYEQNISEETSEGTNSRNRVENIEELNNKLEAIEKRLAELRPIVESTVIFSFTRFFEKKLKINAEGLIENLPGGNPILILEKLAEKRDKLLAKGDNTTAEKIAQQIDAINNYQDELVKRDNLNGTILAVANRKPTLSEVERNRMGTIKL